MKGLKRLVKFFFIKDRKKARELAFKRYYRKKKMWLRSLRYVQRIGCPKCGYFWKPRRYVPAYCPRCRFLFSFRHPPILK